MRAPPQKQSEKWLDRLVPQSLVKLCNKLTKGDTLAEASTPRCATSPPLEANPQVSHPSLQEHIFFLESLPQISSLFVDFTFLNTIYVDYSDSNDADLNANDHANFECEGRNYDI